MSNEPVRLTDPDDPRIKAGARVRWVCEWVLTDEPNAPLFTEYTAEWARRDIKNADPNETYYLIAEAPTVNVNLMLDVNNPDDTADYGDPKYSTGAAPEVTHCFRCKRLAIDHAAGKYSIYGVCPGPAS